jgi:hypothetical protein
MGRCLSRLYSSNSGSMMVYIKYSKKGHFIKEYSTTQGKPLGFKNRAQSKSILENNN